MFKHNYMLSEKCETLVPPSVAVPAVSQLTPRSQSVVPPFGRNYQWPPPQGYQLSLSAVEEDGVCGGTLPAVRSLRPGSATHLYSNLSRLIAADCIASCSAQGPGGTQWNATALSSDHVRRPALSRLLTALRRVHKAITTRNTLLYSLKPGRNSNRVLWSEVSAYLDYVPRHARDTVRLLTLGVTHILRLFVPLAFEHLDIQISDQRLHRWINDLERVRDMLDIKLTGWIQDMKSASEQLPSYKVEAMKNRTGWYLIRLPLLSESLVMHQESYISFHGDFAPICEQRHPNASQVFSLADSIYSFYYDNWIHRALRYSRRFLNIKIIDEEWQLEDRSNATLSVDTGCLQLLANALDSPTCPLDDLPPETAEELRKCRAQLWEDLALRSPHIPVTSYLAYTQRASVSLCLLAWMVTNSRGICQDVPFSMIQSVHDARCYFESPYNNSCMDSSAADTICVVSRAIWLLKCHDFASQFSFTECYVEFYADGSHSKMNNITWNDVFFPDYIKPTKRTFKYKDRLNSATLKYKDFKVDTLRPLEITFVVVNIIFRFLTAGIYMYLPHLRNLPGKILVSFQVTGIVQVLCSEVLYRMAGFPSLSTAVLVDSALTLLGCVWLNSFCYQMYGYIRHLRLPNDLPTNVASRIFRRQVLYVLIPWTIACATCTCLEKASKRYLIHSRILFLAWISLSVTFNLVCLALVGDMYLRTKKSMQKLEIISSNKLGSKKQILYLSAKTVILSGIGVMIRAGFHQAQGIAQAVYYVHLATMLQGPLLFVFFVCDGVALSALRNRVLAWWNPDVIRPGQELCSSAERNLARRVNEQLATAES